MNRFTWKGLALALCFATAPGLVATQAFAATPASSSAESTESTAIQRAMKDIWDKPDSRLEVAPVSILGSHVVAGWIQGSRGGRALLKRNPHGQWTVAACGGDGLKDPKMLEMAGLSATSASQLAWNVAQAEAAMTPKQRALFSSFDGMVQMDPHGAHPGHSTGNAH